MEGAYILSKRVMHNEKGLITKENEKREGERFMHVITVVDRFPPCLTREEEYRRKIVNLERKDLSSSRYICQEKYVQTGC